MLSFSLLLLGFLHIASGLTLPVLEKRSIPQETYDDFVHYWKYCTASSATVQECAFPNGQTRVLAINESSTDTQGFVARDDDRKEIVVSLAGTESTLDTLIDLNIVPVPFLSKGVKAPVGSAVHAGFLIAYNSVADQVLKAVTEQLQQHSGYTLVAAGHSLGGATASLAAVSLQQNFPDVPVRLYTYGQPRTFNIVASAWVNDLFGEQSYRVTHTNDPVPLIVPRVLGYRHQGTEYWQSVDPASAAIVKKCSVANDKEDPTCSLSTILNTNADSHSTYVGISSGQRFCSKA